MTSRLQCALLLCAAVGPAQAADSRDDIRRQALLRAYTTAEVERREELNSTYVQPAARAAGDAVAGMGNALGAMAARAQARSDREQALQAQMYAAVEKGLDYRMQTVGDRDAMRAMLEQQASGKDYLWPARKRLIEFALHQRVQSEQLFPQRNFEWAATELRKNAYAAFEYQPWAALTLAKLYLSGRGVPQDEGEAVDLLNDCTTLGVGSAPAPATSDIISCHLLLSDMHGNNWGVKLSPALQQKHLEAARREYDLRFKKPATDEQLRSLFR